MKLDDIVSLDDILNTSEYIKLLRNLKVKIDHDIDISHIADKVLASWKTGLKSRKHYDRLLNKVNLNLKDLIRK
jgi:hypothetical protein